MDSAFTPLTNQLLGIGERSSSGSDSWLSMIVRKELTEINMLLPELHVSECLLTDMGEYLCRVTTIVAQLAQRMTNGNHIQTYTQLQVNRMREQTDLSELGFLDSMTPKHSALRNLVEKLESVEQEINLVWRECTTAASHGTAAGGKTSFGNSSIGLFRLDRTSSTATPSSLTISNPSQPSPPLTMSNQSQSSSHGRESTTEAPNPNKRPPNGTEAIDVMVESLLRETTHRGRGSHICPYGLSCTKGGISATGSLVPFERNSAFRGHLEKHLKLYKCNLPGCTNKSGFSRPDLLQRHQTGVPHNAPVEQLMSTNAS